MISEGRKAPDMGMPTQAGNNLLHALVMKAKTERQLMGMIDKLALKMGGKYKGKKKATGGAIRLSKGGTVMVQGRGCGAMMNEKRKKTKMPRS